MNKFIAYFKNVLKKYLQKYRVNHWLNSIDHPIYVDGFPDTKNFGDALNVVIVDYLSKKKTFPSRWLSLTKKNQEISYAVIGSVCQWGRPQSVVWGAGFNHEKFKSEFFVKPQEVLAVRGPLTREVFLANNIPCPETYGDPALLLPLFYNPEIEKKYEYGVVPHFADWDSDWIVKQKDAKNTLLINIMIGENYELFVKQLKSCRKIITSSLHALILAHAYDIPVCLVKLQAHSEGEHFKFYDYYLSVNKKPIDFTPIINENMEKSDLLYDSEPLSIDLEPLIAACPFIDAAVKKQLLKKSKFFINK